MKCPRYNEAELRKQIYGALSSVLDRECCIDSDLVEYHDQLFPVQQKMAIEFRALARGARPVPGDSSKSKKR